jgi:alginate O-acetyltransferase complex protein AlgI
MQIPLNFNSPYKATSIIDFWRRWHMTLSAFLRDHVYFPLGGSRCGPWRRYANLFATMLLGGLWHGAGWTYVFWGGLHGAYLVVNHAWVALRKRWGWQTPSDPFAWRATAGLLTFGAVMLGWVFFRAKDCETALVIVESLAGFQGLGWSTTFKWQHAVNLLGFLSLIAWICPNTQQVMAKFEPAFDWARASRDVAPLPRGLRWMAWQPSIGWTLMSIVFALAVLMNMGRVQEFLYFQF